MPRLPPDHRALSILRAAKEQAQYDSDDPRDTALFHLVKSGGDVSLIGQVTEAFDIYVTDEFRHIVDALILGDATDTDIAEALKMNPLVLSPYRHLFFDKVVFSHVLDMYQYVGRLICNRKQRDEYLISMQQGPSVLSERYRIGDRKPVDTREVVNTVLRDLSSRFREHRGHDITSATAQAALRLVPDVLRASALAAEKNGGDKDTANQAITMALNMHDETKTPDEAGVVLGEVAG